MHFFKANVITKKNYIMYSFIIFFMFFFYFEESSDGDATAERCFILL